MYPYILNESHGPVILFTIIENVLYFVGNSRQSICI